MIEKVLALSFWLPLIYSTIILVLSARMYSLRNISIKRAFTDFSIGIGLARVSYVIGFWVIIAFVIISFINKDFIMPIIDVFIAYRISLLIGRKLNPYLSPSRDIPKELMLLNGVFLLITIVLFTYYIIGAWK